MGCIPHKTKKKKIQNSMMTVDQEDDSCTSKDYVYDNYNFMPTSSEKIIVLKPLKYKNTFSSQDNNTYIHKGFSSKLAMKECPNYIHVKTQAMKECDSVDGLNLSKHQTAIIYNTQLIKNLCIE